MLLPVRVWSIESGELVHDMKDAHDMGVMSVAVTADSLTAVSGAWDNNVK
jgi:WD40 repeat protein